MPLAAVGVLVVVVLPSAAAGGGVYVHSCLCEYAYRQRVVLRDTHGDMERYT